MAKCEKCGAEKQIVEGCEDCLVRALTARLVPIERAEKAEVNNADLIARYEAERAPLAARVRLLESTNTLLQRALQRHAPLVDIAGIHSAAEAQWRASASVSAVPPSEEANPYEPDRKQRCEARRVRGHSVDICNMRRGHAGAVHGCYSYTGIARQQWEGEGEPPGHNPEHGPRLGPGLGACTRCGALDGQPCYPTDQRPSDALPARTCVLCSKPTRTPISHFCSDACLEAYQHIEPACRSNEPSIPVGEKTFLVRSPEEQLDDVQAGGLGMSYEEAVNVFANAIHRHEVTVTPCDRCGAMVPIGPDANDATPQGSLLCDTCRRALPKRESKP